MKFRCINDNCTGISQNIYLNHPGHQEYPAIVGLNQLIKVPEINLPGRVNLWRSKLIGIVCKHGF